jgi:IS30 family transposase
VVWNVASRSRAFGSQYLFGPEARLINKRPFQKNCAVRATAASALAGFSAKRNSIAAPLRKSFTYARGKEMLRHQELIAATGVKVYFCDPHSPWQRGTCENTNGLLRQYLPKGNDLSVYSQEELDTIADSLNSRPRATH